MTTNNYLFAPGTMFVAPEAGGAPTPLPVGTDGQQLTARSTATNGLGVDWETSLGTVTTGAAPTKGTFTFNGSGTHTQIATTAIGASSVLVYTITALGTVTAAQAILTTISAGVGFTPVSASSTDSSTVNWAILA